MVLATCHSGWHCLHVLEFALNIKKRETVVNTLLLLVMTIQAYVAISHGLESETECFFVPLTLVTFR